MVTMLQDADSMHVDATPASQICFVAEMQITKQNQVAAVCDTIGEKVSSDSIMLHPQTHLSGSK